MSDLGVMLGGLLALVLAVLGYGRAQRRKGRKESDDAAESADMENALDIRRRASRADERLREYDDAGFRD